MEAAASDSVDRERKVEASAYRKVRRSFSEASSVDRERECRGERRGAAGQAQLAREDLLGLRRREGRHRVLQESSGTLRARRLRDGCSATGRAASCSWRNSSAYASGMRSVRIESA